MIFAVVGYWIGCGINSDTGTGVTFALIGLAIGLVVGWLISIILVAFGELVENSTMIREMMYAQYCMNRNGSPQMQQTAPQPDSVSVPNQSGGTFSVKYCEKCGAPLDESRVCGQCGCRN